MRILVVTLVAPWPEDSGARMRAGNTVRALGAIADVDLYTMANAERLAEAARPPAEYPVRRVRAVARPNPSRVRQRVSWARPGGPPRLFAAWDGALRDDLIGWADASYDLVWVIRAGAYGAVRPLDLGPVVVDLDDLEDRKGIDRADVELTGHRAAVVRYDAGRWTRWQRAIAAEVRSVAVCSELDRVRAGVPNAVVIPNGYAATGEVRPRDAGGPVGESPLLLLQGSLNRPPLIDAARVLAREILPRVRRRHARARAALVGAGGAAVRSLGLLEGVEVTGRVPSMEPWLAAADVVAVPMRWGSGTRIKILEAFAHGVPVVSSTLGAEGLDVEDGKHLLVADDPTAFATRVCDLLDDGSLRRRLAAEARRRYEERYRWGPIHERIAEVARRAAAGAVAVPS